MSVVALRDWLSASLEVLAGARQLGPTVCPTEKVDAASASFSLARDALSARETAADEAVADSGAGGVGDSGSRHFARLLAYVAATWASYDQVHLGLAVLHGHDRIKEPSFAEFIACESAHITRAALPVAIVDVVRRYRWSLAFSYTCRNVLLHGGQSTDERLLCEHTLRANGQFARELTPAIRDALERSCKKRFTAAQPTETRRNEPWPWQAETLVAALELCHDEVDELMGICAFTSSQTLATRALCVSGRRVPER
jgi:hypothetical protein